MRGLLVAAPWRPAWEAKHQSAFLHLLVGQRNGERHEKARQRKRGGAAQCYNRNEMKRVMSTPAL